MGLACGAAALERGRDSSLACATVTTDTATRVQERHMQERAPGARSDWCAVRNRMGTCVIGIYCCVRLSQGEQKPSVN